MNESDTGLKRYLQEIGRIPLLTPHQEIELAGKIKKGDAEARERMINSNLRLVITIAHDYANLGLPLLDLISEGNIGLTKAVERFDPAKGAKLSTYAAWWIKQSIKRALANQSKTIRLPDRLALIGESALDRLFDPPRRIRAQLRPFSRVEALDRFGQSDVSLGDQVKQRQTEIGVIVRDGDNEP